MSSSAWSHLRLDELDVHELVAELVERDAGGHLGPVRGLGTSRTDDLHAARREYQRARTEPRTGHERIGKQNRREDEGPGRRRDERRAGSAARPRSRLRAPEDETDGGDPRTPLTIVTTPSRTVGLSAGSRACDSVIRRS